MNIDPNLVIQDLLSQVQKLTADNTLLRVALQQSTADQGGPVNAAAAPELDKADGPEQTK